MDIQRLPHTVELNKDLYTRKITFRFIDQTKLPCSLDFIETDDWYRVVEAIQRLEVRGAPAIGLAGASAYVLAVCEFRNTLLESNINSKTGIEGYETLLSFLAPIKDSLINARPTAVNLSWAVSLLDTLLHEILEADIKIEELIERLYAQVKKMEIEDEAANRAMGGFGADLLPSSCVALTHCNAGSLATSYYGTALGVIYSAAIQNKIQHVYVDETRPVGQGIRLTAWELSQVGIPATVICDNMAASLMAQGKIDVVIVGADRVCMNGDVANKIGTYNLAVLARYHDIPFYVVAPSSSFDMTLPDGSKVLIEERDRNEVSDIDLKGIDIYNPAFDITPCDLISAYITERGAYSDFAGLAENLLH